MEKEKIIDNLLGALSVEEKAAQLMVLGYTGIFIEPELEEFIDRFGLGGLRVSPVLARKFIRYLPDGSPGIKNVERTPSWREKMFDETIPPPHVSAEEYAELLNRLKKRALSRKHHLPMHTVTDFESGEGGNFIPKGFITPPANMGFGHLGDVDLVRRVSYVLGTQLKAVGIDMIHSPVVDVNTTPKNPEIYTRSYSENQDMVIKCARMALRGLREAGEIACLKHYPGRGNSENDAHFSMSVINLDRKTMDKIHLAPYSTLCGEKIVPAVMPAHSIFPYLDETNEIATVSPKIINGILRDEFGFDGVVTTDSMTMGGLMAKYSVGEACIRALEAGVDLLLLKDDNVLRFEMHEAIVNAIKSGRISEGRINQSLRRVWSMKWDYGIFENGGLVEVDKIKDVLSNEEYHKTGREAAQRVIHVLRDDEKLLPLDPNKKILLVDRITDNMILHNDYWNHPGMLWEFMLKQSKNIGYIDYTPATTDLVIKKIKQVISNFEMVVATGDFLRGLSNDTKPFLRNLRQFGKPIVLVSSNPYEELLIPVELRTVIISYGLMRDSAEAISEFLFRNL